MKKLLLFFAGLYSFSSFSQTSFQYANFIQTDTAVKWAAIYNSYVNLTPVNPNFDVRNFYIKKMEAGNVKAYTEDNLILSVTPYDLNNVSFLKDKKAVDFDEREMNFHFDYDNNIGGFKDAFYSDSNSCSDCITRNKLSFFKVKQLLYYKNNQFRIQNILLSPVVYVKQETYRKDETQYFETANIAFNSANEDSGTIPMSAIFITRAGNEITLLPTAQNHVLRSRILTMNNWSLGRIFFNDVTSKKLHAYDTEKSIYPGNAAIIPQNKLAGYKMPSFKVAIYNINDEVSGYKTMKQEINYDSIYNFLVVQDFYFDFANEKLYSKVIAVVPRMRVITSSGIDLGLTNYWGILFPEERKAVITKKK